MLENSTAVRVVSLVEAAARRSEVAKIFPEGSFSFFDAHTVLSGDLHYDPQKALKRSGRLLAPGELGCYSSHYHLWQWFLESSFSQLLVFEDDVAVDWLFISRLRSIDFSSQNIHFLRLFTKLPFRWKYVSTPYLTPYHHLVRITGFAHGLQAYLLTRMGAEILVRRARDVDSGIDVLLDRYWEHGLPDLAIFPFHVIERGVPSSIGDSRLARKSLGWRDRLTYMKGRSRDEFEILRNRLGMDPQKFSKSLKPKAP
ncbi:MAG: glycosyltransferase family 25 protein [Proteobacteria bacterium]|nr:glycosyltransferase family 25 protein [Pseudomonadota bacterium]